MEQEASRGTGRISTGSKARAPIWKRVLIVAAAVIGPLVLYLLFWPVPTDPYAWEPATDPGRTGPYVPNQDLAATQFIELAGYVGSKDVATDAYVGPEDVAIGP